MNKRLRKQIFNNGIYSLVPIRHQDKYKIMKWRNEQIYHLRQGKPLTKMDQDKYFNTIVSSLATQKFPDQILFSYLERDKCIGYGGLVHINYLDKHAEISFIMDTSLESDFFEFHWGNYVKMIEEFAFKNIQFHKLFVYAFDLRPNLYRVLETCAYFKDAVLKEHCFYSEKFIDVVIYSKLNQQ